MAPRRPKPHDLTRRARADIDAIWDYTARHWSPKLADTYVRGIAAAIKRICLDPGMVRERAEYDPPVRIYRCASHIIIYLDQPERVSIIRVRHGSEDWASDLAGGADEQP